MSYRYCRNALLAIVGFVAVPVGAWPCLLGTDQAGVSNDKGLARSWPVEGPPILWTTKVAPGYGGPVIRDGEVFILDRVDQEQDVVRCLDFVTGRQLWEWPNLVPGRLTHDGSLSTPTVDADRVYAVGPFGHVYCVDRKTRRALWQIELMTEYPKDPPQFGFAQSPLLYRDTVIVAPLTDTVGLIAVDQKTGQIRWSTDPIGTKSYTSPTLRNIDGVDCVIFITDQQISGIDPASGGLLWKFTDYNPPQQAAIPTWLEDGRMFVTAFDDAGSVMIDVSREDGQFEVEEQFRIGAYGAQLHPTLFYENHLYGKYFVYNARRKLASRLMCHDLEGNVRWNEGEDNRIERGNFIIADGMLVNLDVKSGELILAEAKPETYNELARAKILDLDGRSALSPMAMNGGRLIVRDYAAVKCVDLREPAKE